VNVLVCCKLLLAQQALYGVTWCTQVLSCVAGAAWEPPRCGSVVRLSAYAAGDQLCLCAWTAREVLKTYYCVIDMSHNMSCDAH
jgi:hypothetical protein